MHACKKHARTLFLHACMLFIFPIRRKRLIHSANMQLWIILTIKQFEQSAQKTVRLVQVCNTSSILNFKLGPLPFHLPLTPFFCNFRYWSIYAKRIEDTDFVLKIYINKLILKSGTSINYKINPKVGNGKGCQYPLENLNVRQCQVCGAIAQQMGSSNTKHKPNRLQRRESHHAHKP